MTRAGVEFDLLGMMLTRVAAGAVGGSGGDVPAWFETHWVPRSSRLNSASMTVPRHCSSR